MVGLVGLVVEYNLNMKLYGLNISYRSASGPKARERICLLCISNWSIHIQLVNKYMSIMHI